MLQMPLGQAPRKKPQPMQRLSSTTNSTLPSVCSLRVMACCPQMNTQMLQSRQVPQEMHRSVSSSGGRELTGAGSKVEQL